MRNETLSPLEANKRNNQAKDIFKHNCQQLARRVKAALKEQGYSAVQKQLDYLNDNPNMKLPLAELSHTDTIEIYQQCITDYIQKLEIKKAKQAA